MLQSRLVACLLLLAVAAACRAETLGAKAFEPADVAAEPDVEGTDVAAPQDADTAAAEVAVAVDADADAGVDAGEPECGAKACPVSQDPCKVNDCQADGTCKLESAADGTPCDDGNACTTGDSCKSGACFGGGAKACDDGNPCTADSCDQADGQCLHAPAGSGDCDDGNPCTLKDECQAGQCVGNKNPNCTCQGDADCPDDANLCNGMPFCDKSTSVWKCAPTPGTVVSCPESAKPCLANACAPATGKCEPTAINEGKPCEQDGLACTQDECLAGQCVTPKGSDTCICKTNADCNELDEDLCDGVQYCDKTGPDPVCKLNPASVVKCSTSFDTPCLKNTCDKKTGKCEMQVPSTVDGKPITGIACTDGNPCTTGDVCEDGKCVAGASTCACSSDADCGPHEDGNFCNGTLFCDKTAGKCVLNPATVVTCPTVNNTTCAENVCDQKTGKCVMTAMNEFQPCDADGSTCTPKDFCESGTCKVGPNFCFCQADADCAKQDDGDLCNGTMICDKTQNPAACVLNPATVVKCQTVNDTVCQQNKCVPLTGKCKMTPIAKVDFKCDDGNPCTKGDTCQGGQCLSGPNTCPCTSDAECANKQQNEVAAGTYDLCDGDLFCDKTLQDPNCVINPATVVVCNPAADTVCLKNQCAAATGVCALTPVFGVNVPCDDGNACTVVDVCEAGKCQSGTNTCDCQTDSDCAPKDDANLCKGKLFCDKGAAPFKCVVNPATVVTCSTGSDAGCLKNQCQAQNGQCEVKPAATACDDGNACTADSCGVDGKCANVPYGDGTACAPNLDCKGGVCGAK